MTKTILVVEDEKSVQKLLKDMLEEEGFTVLLEKDGKWGLSTFENRDVDLVIMDVLLPGQNGFQVVESIRQTSKGKTIPIMMISGVYRGPEHKREALEDWGCVAYVHKPFKSEDVLAPLRELFGEDYPEPRPAAVSPPPTGDEAPPPPPTEDDYADQSSLDERAEVETTASRMVMKVEAIKGNLRATPFPEVMAQISRLKATGALLVSWGKIKKIVFFEDGRPIFVKSNLTSECLGRVLVKEGMISEAECEESLRLMKHSDRKQGTILIEMGAISPHNLGFALEKQLEAKLFDIFGWPEGEYQFNPNANLPQAITTFEGSPAQLIWEGIRRSYDDARIRKEAAPLMKYYAAPSRDPLYRYQDIQTLGEEKLLPLIDGSRTIAQIIKFSGVDEIRAMKLIHALKVADIITLAADPITDPGPLMTASSPAAEPPPLPAGPPPLRKRESSSQPPPLGERVLRERLAQRAMELRRKNLYQILGLKREAGEAEIRRAYFEQAKEFHPDRYASAVSSEIKALAAEIYGLVTKAYETLSDHAARAAYDAELDSGIRRDMASDVSRMLAAEGQFQQGEMYLRNEEFAKAANCFNEARNLYADEGDYHAYYGWSLYKSHPGEKASTAEAIRAINEAISLNPRSDKPYVFLGSIYKETGEAEKANQQFEKALQANPDCVEALLELKLDAGQRRRQSNIFRKR
ncbi:MAG: Chaperone protein DnaJ [Myxococcota bacterium]|nr:Chaperone protein DnaJ [Myxococcota bacterium]